MSEPDNLVKSAPEKGVRGLIEVFVKAALNFLDDDGTLLAAAIAYYSMLSVVPLLLALASIASFFIDQQWAIEQATMLLDEYVPQGVGRIRDIVHQAIDQRESVGLISTITFFWSGSRVFSALTRALNSAFNVEDSYSFLRRTALELSMAVSIGLFFIVALVASVVLNLLIGVLNVLPNGQDEVSFLLSEGLSLSLLLVAFFLIYKVVPRHKVGQPAALVGALTATVLFTLGRPLFLRYVGQFANYNEIYGPLAIVIVLVFWAWISAVILLYGGEVAAQVEEMLRGR
ncbi:MAG: YihY/virulence factor BrkB family protein [Candidatus Promineifilaceae bacterium]|nr:YihY/virulence factor BrkB family protein [Candidatus Promineifilaceae bacterium]